MNFLPCRGRTAEQEIWQILKSVGLNTISRFWVFVADDDDPICSWDSYSPESNCVYLQKFMEVAKKNFGITVGVLTNKGMWDSFFEPPASCP